MTTDSLIDKFIAEVDIVDKASSIAESIIKNKLSEKSQQNIMLDSVETTKNIFN